MKLGGSRSDGKVDPRAKMTCLQQRICRAVCTALAWYCVYLENIYFLAVVE